MENGPHIPAGGVVNTARDVSGVLIQAGTVGAVHVHQAPTPTVARSAYPKQVRRIAPQALLGREEELGELARFCLEPERGPYVWWQAPAWAGKTALLSAFVLDPPPEVRQRVVIVSFFITARLAAQDTKDAFMRVVLEQLATVLHQPVPSMMPATREADFLDLMDQAARACQEKDQRLVLVLDGLDEDRSSDTSIAGLLPACPPAGMRMIVAGRPSPPIPDDVPPDHPLFDPGIIKNLSQSQHARAIQRQAERELKSLLRGSQVELDVLRVVTAARGGLSIHDLEELTDAPLWEVQEILNRVTGRSFVSRTGLYGTADTYLLGHEELQATATRALGKRLAEYRNRLHVWADAYRANGWSSETPEYLMTGYFSMLTASRDLPRMVACADDVARHDRMLDVTGGDAAALTEIRQP